MKKVLIFQWLAVFALGSSAFGTSINDSPTASAVDEIFTAWDSTSSPGCGSVERGGAVKEEQLKALFDEGNKLMAKGYT